MYLFAKINFKRENSEVAVCGWHAETKSKTQFVPFWKCLRIFQYIYIEKETLVQVFSCEFSEISKNTFLHTSPPVATSANKCQLP